MIRLTESTVESRSENRMNSLQAHLHKEQANAAVTKKPLNLSIQGLSFER